MVSQAPRLKSPLWHRMVQPPSYVAALSRPIRCMDPRLTSLQCMIAVAKLSDKFGNRGWPTQFGWTLLIVGFAIFLGAPTDNKPAHFAALILAETGHYGKQSTSPHLYSSLNSQLTIVCSLHPPNRNLVRQQRRQRIPPCRRGASCSRTRTSRRVSSFPSHHSNHPNHHTNNQPQHRLRLPFPRRRRSAIHARRERRSQPLRSRHAVHFRLHGFDQVGECSEGS